MRLTADFHSHTGYSDGSGSVAGQAARAKELGLRALAVTDHGFSHRLSGLRRGQFQNYREDIARAEKTYGVELLVGIEENVLGREGSLCLRPEELEALDVLLVGYHVMSRHERFRDFWNGWRGFLGKKLGFRPPKGLVSDQTRGYLETVKKNPVDILTHLNFRCYSDALEVAKCCADYGTYIEISGRKPHLTDEELCEIANKTSVRFVLDSDAHDPKKLGDVSLALSQIGRTGVPLSRVDNLDGRMPQFRLAEYKKRNA